MEGCRGHQQPLLTPFCRHLHDTLTNNLTDQTKIIPAITKDKFHSIVTSSKAYSASRELVDALWAGCGEQMYAFGKRVRELGIAEKG